MRFCYLSCLAHLSVRRTLLALAVLSTPFLAGCPDLNEEAYGPLTNAALRYFESRLVYKVGGQAIDVVAADFNHDNRPDLAAINRDKNSVSVLIALAEGGYAKAVDYTVGDAPSALIIADIDSNTQMDIVTANETYDQVTILPGNGDGTFGAGKVAGLVSGSKPRGLAAADLNGDGKADIITADSVSSTITVLTGKGDFTFNDPVRFPAGSSPRSVIAVDLTGDGKPEVVTANWSSNDLSVFVNTGADLLAPLSLSTGTSPRMVATADFNGDGKADLLASNAGSSDFSLYLSNGDGTFAVERRAPLGQLPTRVVTGDFNKDGKQDLAALIYASEAAGSLGIVAIMTGDGAGGFSTPGFFGAGGQSFGLAAADLDKDGTLDLAVSDAGSAIVSVLRGRGDGRFETDQRFPSGTTPRVAALADFNKDGKPDLAVANFDNNNVTILLGNGAGVFARQPAPLVLPGKPRALAAGDLNGDDKLDLVVGVLGQSVLAVFLGQGNGLFAAAPSPRVLPTDSVYLPQVRSLALGDMNGDGKLDIITGNSGSDSVSILIGDGAGKFGAANELKCGNYPLNLSVPDLNRDGKRDVAFLSTNDPDVTTDKAEPRVVRFFGKGDGAFDAESGLRVATGGGPYDMTLGDVDGSSTLDAVTVHPNDGTIYLLSGTADGKFTAGKGLKMGVSPIGVVTRDMNGDGKADLITTHSAGHVVLRLSRGGMAFETPNHFLIGNNPQSSLVGDVNGDGKPDLITLNAGTSDVSVLLGRTP